MNQIIINTKTILNYINNNKTNNHILLIIIIIKLNSKIHLESDNNKIILIRKEKIIIIRKEKIIIIH